MEAVRAVGVFNNSTRPVVRDWGRQKWWPKLMVCKLWELTAGTCAVVRAGANSKDWGQLWAQQVAQRA